MKVWSAIGLGGTPAARGAMKGVVVVVLVAAAAAAAAGDKASRTSGDRIFTAQQAERGEKAYKRACVQCHPMNLYRGDVMKSWDGAPLFNLYDLIVRTMPQGNPGSLKPREYVDMLAYILSLNGMPAGKEELPARPDALKAVRIQWRSTS